VAKTVDLSSPVSRGDALRMVDVGYPRPHHAMLREIFDLERAWREGPDSGESDEYEQIYVTAFLLFLIGDPADSRRLYAAKFRTADMDLGVGFDATPTRGVTFQPSKGGQIQIQFSAALDTASACLASPGSSRCRRRGHDRR
jgi:hypothetical protein